MIFFVKRDDGDIKVFSPRENIIGFFMSEQDEEFIKSSYSDFYSFGPEGSTDEDAKKFSKECQDAIGFKPSPLNEE